MHEGYHSYSLGLPRPARRGGGDHRGPRPGDGRADRRAAPPLSPVVRRLGRARASREGGGHPRDRRGHAAPSRVHRRRPRHLRHQPEGEPTAADARRIATRCGPGSADGTIDAIATDHAPHAVEDKEAEFDQSPPGTIGLETALAAVLTELVEPGVLTLARAIEALSTAPARILGASEHGGPDRTGPPREPGRVRPDVRVGGGAAVRVEEPQLRVPRLDAARPGRPHDAPRGVHRGEREGHQVTGAPALLALEDGTVFRGTGVRRGGGGVRRGRVQHRDVRLPGGADRPVVRGADRRDDGAAARATTA